MPFNFGAQKICVRVALSFVSIGNRTFVEQFYHRVRSIKWITDRSGFRFENLSLSCGCSVFLSSLIAFDKSNIMVKKVKSFKNSPRDTRSLKDYKKEDLEWFSRIIILVKNYY